MAVARSPSSLRSLAYPVAVADAGGIAVEAEREQALPAQLEGVSQPGGRDKPAFVFHRGVCPLMRTNQVE